MIHRRTASLWSHWSLMMDAVKTASLKGRCQRILGHKYKGDVQAKAKNIHEFLRWSMIQEHFECDVFSPTAECCGVFAQYRFRCVLGELGRVPGRNRVPGTGSRFRWVPTGSQVQKMFQVWMRSDRFRGFQGSGTGWHNAAGSAARRVNAFVKTGTVKPLCCWGYHLLCAYFCFHGHFWGILSVDTSFNEPKSRKTGSNHGLNK